MSGVSESVLDALARALQLDEAEREHLFDLARAAGPMRRPAQPPGQATSGPACSSILDAITARRAFVRNDRLDILAATPRLRRVLRDVPAPGPAGQRPGSSSSTARQALLPRLGARRRRHRRVLRIEAGRDPYDRDLSDLVGELSTRSEDFRARWAAHKVRFHRRRQALPPPGRRRPQPQRSRPGRSPPTQA